MNLQEKDISHIQPITRSFDLNLNAMKIKCTKAPFQYKNLVLLNESGRCNSLLPLVSI